MSRNVPTAPPLPEPEMEDPETLIKIIREGNID
jgi:hypothetical protein